MESKKHGGGQWHEDSGAKTSVKKLPRIELLHKERININVALMNCHRPEAGLKESRASEALAPLHIPP